MSEDEKKKETRLNIRMSEEIKQDLKIRALKKNMTLTEYITYLAMKDISENERKELNYSEED